MLTGQQMTMHTANCLARMSRCTGQSDWVHHFVRFVTMLMSIYNDFHLKLYKIFWNFGQTGLGNSVEPVQKAHN